MKIINTIFIIFIIIGLICFVTDNIVASQDIQGCIGEIHILKDGQCVLTKEDPSAFDKQVIYSPDGAIIILDKNATMAPIPNTTEALNYELKEHNLTLDNVSKLEERTEKKNDFLSVLTQGEYTGALSFILLLAIHIIRKIREDKKKNKNIKTIIEDVTDIIYEDIHENKTQNEEEKTKEDEEEDEC